MKAAQYSAHGVPNEVVEIVDMPAAKPAAGEALIDILATPINPSDMLTISGLYGSLPKLPSVPGNEGIGRVAEVGADVKTVKPGDRVFLPLGCGTWREQVTVPGAGLFALPEGGDAVQLSMLMINPPTAHLLLALEKWRIRPSQYVASSSVKLSMRRAINSTRSRSFTLPCSRKRRASFAPDSSSSGRLPRKDIVLP